MSASGIPEWGSYRPTEHAAELEGAGRRWRRRLLAFARVYFLFFLLSILLPPLLILAAITDLVRSVLWKIPPTAVRLLLFMFAFLAVESVAIPLLGISWLMTRGNPEALARQTFQIQKVWNALLFDTVQSLFGLTVRIEGASNVHPGPVLILIRHSSIVDVLLPVVFIGVREDMRLRFVLKRELLNDPCLDIAGQRLPNYFVARTASDSDKEVESIVALSRQMGRQEGLLIYPEGTRFTPQKHAEAVAKLRQTSPELADIAQTFQHVLPPRLKGAMALLEEGLDVVFMAHVGLDQLTHFTDLWKGGLVKRAVHIKLWRISAKEVPRGKQARARWLMLEWQKLDKWIDEARKWGG